MKRLLDELDLIAWNETRFVPRCDLCHKVTHRSKLRTLPPSRLEQAPIDLCPDCWNDNRRI